MSLRTRPSNSSAGSAPQKVELLYSVSPDVLKPNVDIQTKLTQFVKTEAMERLSQGMPLTFRLSIAGLFTVEVTPGGEDIPLPRRGNIALIVKRKDGQHGSQVLLKQVEPFLLAEETYPCEVWRERYEALVGLKDIKQRVLSALQSLFSEEFVRQWSEKFHCQAQAFHLLQKRYPVFIFDGVPGVGKTELAHAIGDPLARVLGSEVVSYSIGLQLRGAGLVGELSQNICNIIEFGKMQHAQRGVPILLIVDEGDAIAHSRDMAAQHHEESVGVNTLLQQIDLLQGASGVALIFTTNRHGALDSALASRGSAHRVSFPQPDYGLRFYLFKRLLGDVLGAQELRTLAHATDGFAPRDIVELCQAAFLEAMSTDSPVNARHLLRAISLLTQPSSSRRHSRRHGGTINTQEYARNGNSHERSHIAAV